MRKELGQAEEKMQRMEGDLGALEKELLDMKAEKEELRGRLKNVEMQKRMLNILSAFLICCVMFR